MSSHHSEQMSQRSQFCRIALKRCSQNVFVFVNFVLVSSCLLITLNKCLKGHKSLGSLCSGVKTLIASGARPTDGRTRSHIELLWTAKTFIGYLGVCKEVQERDQKRPHRKRPANVEMRRL